ncbi:3'-5' exonuclease [Pontibacter sp. BAB1700]|uniref:3'-5' exonuclease n=1 Tax=Pontibacter sp. BAB1700 TaxID=1144253 RepID=UPI00026BE3E5|nr:3'-5' exonuclease [Pontibacter sp. BAB1700]EJF09933.1 exonuclease RNase T and DNA polymerase III [Pontibacter sp. BAB1700]
MNTYLLFVDTETSGLPKDWSMPYSARDNWPHIVQVAWEVYTRQGEFVKSENFYIKPSNYEMNAVSERIHGISLEFLEMNGTGRYEALHLLQQDLIHYQPLVVGHFMQLDYKMLGLGFYRAGLDNPLEHLPTFCTMLATNHFVREARHRHMRLGELHMRLFGEPLQNEHDARSDAHATARSFFELWRRGDIDEQTVQLQQEPPPPQPLRRRPRSHRRRLLHFVVFLLLVFILYLIALLLT